MDPVYRSFFDKLAAKVVTSRSELKKHLKPGDVFVTSMVSPEKQDNLLDHVVDRGFRVVSRGLQGEWTHAGMYVGDGKVVEMRDQLHHRKLEDSFPAIDAKVLRPKVPAKVRSEAAREAVRIAKEKNKIDYTSVPFMLKMVAEDVTKKRTFKDEGEEDIAKRKFTCSNLVTHAFRGKLRLAKGKGRGYVIPKDFVESPKLTEVVTYRNPKRYDPERRSA